MKLFQFISSEAMKLPLDLQGWIWLRQVFKQKRPLLHNLIYSNKRILVQTPPHQHITGCTFLHALPFASYWSPETGVNLNMDNLPEGKKEGWAFSLLSTPSTPSLLCLPNQDWRVLRLKSGWLSEAIRPGDSISSLSFFSMPHSI